MSKKRISGGRTGMPVDAAAASHEQEQVRGRQRVARLDQAHLELGDPPPDFADKKSPLTALSLAGAFPLGQKFYGDGDASSSINLRFSTMTVPMARVPKVDRDLVALADEVGARFGMPDLLNQTLNALLPALGSAGRAQVDAAVEGARELITALSQMTPEEARGWLSKNEVDLEQIASDPHLQVLSPWFGKGPQAQFLLQALRQIAA